jgi:hypothetical protein
MNPMHIIAQNFDQNQQRINYHLNNPQNAQIINKGQTVYVNN